MSYSYFLVRLKKPYINSLKDFDSLEHVEQVDMSMEHAKKQIIETLPEVKWDNWKWLEIKYPSGAKKTLWSQAKNLGGRFEVHVSNNQFLHVNIDGSHHVDQRKEVIKIAKILIMSVIDIQTGDIIHLQDEQ